jgi:FG-GAP repeat
MERRKGKNMRKKIVGILICMLLIATAIPAVTSVKNSEITATIPNTLTTSMTGDWTETQKLLASDGTANDAFGNLVAMDGDYALIPANHDDQNGVNAGSAYVYVRTGNNWTQQAKLLPNDGAAGDLFGSPAIDGDTILIGAGLDDDNGENSGSAYIFTRTGSTWTQQAKLLAPDGAAGDYFGSLVSLSGDTALIGAPFDDDNGVDSGSAYVFIRTGTIWTYQEKLLAPDGQAGDEFGWSVSLDSDTALIGAITDDDKGVDSGSAYVFIRTGTTWSQQQKLLATDGTYQDIFGQAVALDGDTALIAAPGDGINSTQTGSAYIFTRYGVTWTEKAKLVASDAGTTDQFGSYAVSLDGDTAIIGSYLDDDQGSNSGSAYVFTCDDGIQWTEQQKLLASDGAAQDEFGSVALDGDCAIITSWHDDDNGLNSGSAYVFTKIGVTFSIEGGMGVKAIIKNEGTTDANDIPWQIHVEGGMLGMINKTVNETIDIPAGESVTVNTGLLLGFGPISIVAKVADEEQNAEGTQIIIFSMI